MANQVFSLATGIGAAVGDRTRGPMLYVSLLVEALRARPGLLLWIAALSQAVLWVLVPLLVYVQPPGDLPLLLAVGHEWPLSSPLGPPLTFWIAELAFRIGGMTAVYVLSQACVVVAFWAVFTLGRSIVGTHHAVMAVLLMVGVLAFSVPTPEFGPAVLAMPLIALALLYGWRVLRESGGDDRPWLPLALTVGLLMLTTSAAPLFVGLLAVFVLVHARGRVVLARMETWILGLFILVIALPLTIFAWRSGSAAVFDWPAWSSLLVDEARFLDWLRIIAWLIISQAAMMVLLVVAGGVGAPPGMAAPAFDRAPVDPFARRYIYYFTLMPAFVASIWRLLLDQPITLSAAGPLLILSGLAVIVAAGDVIHLYRSRIVGLVWLTLLLAPAVLTMAAVILLPWTFAVDLAVARPAPAMAQFFTESFRRRTGRPLEIVVGDREIAAPIALYSTDRPSLSLDPASNATHFVNDATIQQKGAVVVWSANETGMATAAVPPSIKARFPDLVAEVPRSFERRGRLPLLRIGWGMIRPASAAAPPR